MKKALFPGSFDPITNGHLHLIQRATNLFDEVIVGVAQNTGKNGLFTLDERTQLAQEAVQAVPNVHVATIDGLTVDFAHKNSVTAIIRGLRNAQDFNYEQPIAAMNAKIGQIETLFMLADPDDVMISSSVIKEIAHAGGDVSAFVPTNVNELLIQKIKE
ncbi:pantetheine-phosphate adenylyltransferase [Weissella uvarum]|uniref:pantetheine-phosphate adenylyltransferase n=1 Tax=Weissella uvarum TaxID=1479233 RepID=UPI00195FC6D8|nr:pantetheine-phosphate adenylyltransferase [Weissella uvarum]MBM7617520.1 pantetheine-phosphate adenylyltransferase [Weissella uvarum]MCM0595596.1 pantetheine-phosphate adenylyltransferase [Weissella uvarum]